MRTPGHPCEMCGNPNSAAAAPRTCPGCDRAHRLCILCEIVHGLVDVGGPDTDRLRVCPEALMVADALMGPEGIEAEEAEQAKEDGA